MDGVARKLSDRLLTPNIREGYVVLAVSIAGAVVKRAGLLGVPGWLLVVLPVLWVALRVVLPFYWSPLIYELPLEYWDARYVAEYGQSARNGVDESQRRSRRGPFSLPVYPNGWFKVADSSEVPIGAIKNVHFWGRDLVVFRGQDGRVGVLDAYCPHLGAHLGVGGRVTGNCIQCPFHGWSFDRSGQCKSIPYTDGDIPTNANAKSFVIEETHRVILLWFDAEGRAPTWRLEDAWPQIPSDYTYEGKAVHHIGCHISEVPENGADVAHLNILHEAVHPVARWLGRLLAVKHKWTASWEPSAQNSAFTEIELTERVFVGAKQHSVLPAANDSTIRQVGPGIVILKLTNMFGEIVLLQTLSPHKPFHQRLETMLFAAPSWSNFHVVMKLFLLGYAEQVERDILIWNKKIYKQKPLLVKGDGPIGKFRRWYAQFFSEHSPTWESVQENPTNVLSW